MTKQKPPAKPRAPKRRAGSGDTEARILAAARSVFTRVGTSGARMQDIAKEAGVNQALLHYYFRSKQALADHVFREAATTLFAELPATIRDDAPLEDVLRAFVHKYLETVRRTPFLPGYMAAEAHQNPARVAAILESLVDRRPGQARSQPFHFIQALFETRVARGEMRPIKAEHLMVNMMALLAFPFVARGLLAGVFAMDDAAFERFLDERRDEVPRFILNAVRP